MRRIIKESNIAIKILFSLTKNSMVALIKYINLMQDQNLLAIRFQWTLITKSQWMEKVRRNFNTKTNQEINQPMELLLHKKLKKSIKKITKKHTLNILSLTIFRLINNVAQIYPLSSAKEDSASNQKKVSTMKPRF